MRLRPNVIAMMRDARAMVEGEMGERVDGDRLMETVFAAFLLTARAARTIPIRDARPPVCKSGDHAHESGSGA
jgi:hypothetical protein